MQRDLVIRAMAGEHDAFSELVRVGLAQLYVTARLILRDSELAEDAVQEALIAAWRDLSGLRDPARFEAWLRSLLVRACYREAGKERRRRRIDGQCTESVIDGLNLYSRSRSRPAEGRGAGRRL